MSEENVAAGILGRIKTNGKWGAFKEGLGQITNVRGENANLATAGFRAGSVVVGVGLIAHSAKSRTKDGEKRSKLVRLVELVAGGLIGYFGVAGGAVKGAAPGR